MFNSKQEVDRHVEKCLRNLNSEVERNLRGLAFAKMYFKVGDCDQALRYVTVYLNVKPASAEGQNLHGKILQRLGKTSQALEAYRLSLDLEPKQNNLVLKICELMAKEQHHFDPASARYYCEKAQSVDPNNPVIFHLKERIVAAASKDPNDVTKLLLQNLESRPLDVDVRVRLLRHLVQHNRARDAYTHAYDIEQKHIDVYLNHIKWCETVVEVLEIYRSTNSVLTWEFWMLYVSALDRYVALSLNDRTKDLEYAPLVLNLDQAMQLAMGKLSACPQKQLVHEFWLHYTGQLCWHFVTFLYKQARKALIKYREVGHVAVPLLFATYGFKPADVYALWLNQAAQSTRVQIQRWHREAAYRCAQSGYMLAGLAHGRKKTILERGKLGVMGSWKEGTFKFLFITREQQNKANTSFFTLTNQLLDVQIRLPETADLVGFTKTAQLVHPDSLHHHIWLGLNTNLADFECLVFSGLQYTVKTFTNCAAETLSVLDIQAFIYAATLCGQVSEEEQKHSIYYNADRPAVLPIACTDFLGTAYQQKWLHCAYQMYTNQSNSDLSEVRMTLVRGIETVRCVGNHGLDARLLVQLARRFTERGLRVAKQSEIEANEARAELYWRAALYLLEKHKKNEHVSHASNRLFEYKVKELNQDQIQQAINEGKLFLGKQAMKKKDFETAINAFKNVKDAYASFYQGQIYRMMADKETNLKSENVTSEMRSQNVILLTKARDCFYLTSDRLRVPGADPRHPLIESLPTEIEKIERLLSRFDPDNNRNECDGISDDNVSSIESDFNYTLSRLETTNHGVHSTPFRMDQSRREVREARPSPERLDAQIRQLAASKDIALNKVLEQNKIVMETQKGFVEGLKIFKESVTDLKTVVFDLKGVMDGIKTFTKSVEEFDNLRTVNDMVYELKREIAELKKEAAAVNVATTSKSKQNQLSDEDLYVFDDDYAAEIANAHTTLSTSMYQNASRMNQGVQNLGYSASPMYGYPMYSYGGMPGMPLPQVPGVSFPQSHHTDAATAHLAADYRAMNLLQGYSQLAPGMPPSTLTAQQIGTSPAYIGQQYPLPTSNLFGTASTQVQSAAVPPVSQALPFGLTSLQSALPCFGLASTIATTTPSSSLPIVSSISAASNIATSTSRPPPVNVVITSSDPLPKTVVSQQQILSVTIPPEHLKGSKVHNYQISLPSSVSSVATAPSVLSQAPLVVSTQSLLSNVSPPVYSALAESPPKTTGSSALGLQIEKSLNNSFNRTANDSECDISRDDEHDPCPDFKPIIPLPDEVAVTTGEESESILFRERAKLFRYVNGEWKERGIGELKILEHNDTKKVRLLMRRDQVHKICANHYLEPNMELYPMNKNPKAYIWPANDFSDGSVALETFCVQFKTPELAKKFYDCFEKAKTTKAVVPTKTGVAAPTSASVPAVTTPTKPASTSAFNAPKTSPSLATSNLGGFKFTSPPTFKPTNDETPKVSTINPVETVKSVASPFAAFSFTSSNTSTTPASKPFASLTFAAAAGAAITDAKQTPATNLFAAFSTTSSLSSPHKNTPISAPVKSNNLTPLGKAAPPPADSRSPGMDSDTDDFVPTAEFKPVIPLPDIVEVKTGEEDAEVLFENKAKLLRYDNANKEWKERGVGQMKILQGNHMLRLVMRRQQVHKVCCNHQVLKEMQFSKMPKTQNAIMWSAKDFSEGKLSTEMLAIRFKTEEIATKFLQTIQNSQSEMDDWNCIGRDVDWECDGCLIVNQPGVSSCVACGKAKFCFGVKPQTSANGALYSFGTPTSSGGFGERFKPAKGSWECQECYTRNDSNQERCACCELPKTDAERGAPSSTISTLKGVDLSTGELSFSFGMPAGNTPKTQSSEIQAVSSTTVSNTGFGDQFKPKVGSWECSSCYTHNDADKLYCLSCEGPKDDTVPPKSTLKGVDLSTGGQQFSFGILAKTAPTAETKSTFSFNALGAETTKTGFSFSLTSTPSKTEEGNVEEVFGSPHKVGFEFTPRSPRRQSGGQQLDEEGGDNSYYEDEEANVYFKPVIPLPDKVQVTTGEEDEDSLYCHRAKLYRHTAGEWKERGIGDLKILFQKEQRKLRVLMRREQIHKICLNHVLTRDVHYSKKDDKTWLFNVPDFSQGEIEHCSFCLRFKSADVAEEFMKAINDALKRIATDGDLVDALDGSESDVEFVSETQVSAEEQEEAKRLLLPPKFMAYRQLEDCQCEQCAKEDAEEKGVPLPQKSIFGGGISSTATTGTIFGTPKGTFSFASFGSPKPDTPAPAKGESVKDLLLKPSLLGTSATSTFSFASADQITKSAETSKTSPFSALQNPLQTGGSIFGKTSLPATPFSGGSIFGQAGALATSGVNIFGGGGANKAAGGSTFSFAGLAKQAEKKEEPKSTSMFSFANVDKPKGTTATITPSFGSAAAETVLGENSSVSFASLAANAENMPFGKPKASTENPFANLGAGAPIFGSKTASKVNTSKTEDGDEGAAGDAEHDPHYDPIIPLPDEVDVKTGEEDEEVLFSERGKLYRFANKEWKERGVGNIKILFHPGNNTYRMLLRREAVHKIVLNQRITVDLDIIAFNLSANAWMWWGMNYGEEGHVLEQLAVRFKNETLAHGFYAAIQKAIAGVKTSPSTSAAAGNAASSHTAEAESDVEDEEDEDKDDDCDDEDDDRTVMNSCECALYELVGCSWSSIIHRGLAEVVYDRESGVSRITIANDVGIVLSNTLIAMNTDMERKPDENGCELQWKAVEYAADRCDWRTLKLQFDSEEEAEGFYMSYLEGKTYAEQADIIDEIPRDGYYDEYKCES